jgi:hypothetical protein
MESSKLPARASWYIARPAFMRPRATLTRLVRPALLTTTARGCKMRSTNYTTTWNSDSVLSTSPFNENEAQMNTYFQSLHRRIGLWLHHRDLENLPDGARLRPASDDDAQLPRLACAKAGLAASSSANLTAAAPPRPVGPSGWSSPPASR